jgi:hypothetical protein
MAREFKTGYKVTGDASGGVRAAQATRQELDKLNNSIQNQTKLGKLASGDMGKYAAGIAGAAAVAVGAVAGITRFAQAVAEPADRIRDLSIQLGQSAEFISGMGYAAEQSGSSLEQFAAGQLKLGKNIAALRDGATKQTEVFGRLGLTYQDLKDLSPEQHFLTLADRIKAIEDPTLRSAAAADVFGKSVGPELVPLLLEGQEGILGMIATAERLGIVISKEFADQADAFNDSLGDSKAILEGTKIQIAEGLLPSLTALQQGFAENAEASDTWVEAGVVLGNTVRVLVAAFITLREIVILTGETIWATGKVIVETLIAILAPIMEFGKTLDTAFSKLISGDFGGFADAFTGLGTRMKDAFVDNITVVGDTLKEFGQGAAVRVQKAVADVNDVLTRQAVVSEKAAAATEELAEQTGLSAKEAEAAAKAYQALTDRLDPLSKLQRDFSAEQALLNAKIAEGGDDVLYYEGLLIQLQAEYSRSKAEATGWGNAAEAAGQKGVDASERAAAAAQKEADDRAKALAQQAADVETFQKAFERGIERLDDLGADLWRGMFTGAKNAMDSIKDFFLNWLAEMAHAAITRPILVSMTAAMGIGGSSGAMAGIPGGVGGISSAIGGGGFNWSSLSSLFTGNSIGQAFASMPSWLGGSVGTLGPNYGIAGVSGASGGSGLFANAGAVSNFWYAGAAIFAGILGDKIFGGQGGTGASLGATIGTAILPGIGTVVGAVLGGFLGGLIKDRPAVLEVSTENRSGLSASDEDRFYDSAFGGVNLRSRRVESEALDELGQAITSLDDFVAQFTDTVQKGEITDALSDFSIKMEGEIDFQKVLADRFGIILGTFSQTIQDYVNEFEGLEDQLGRLGMAATAQKLIDAAPDLFEGRTFREFISVAEAMQVAGEDLTVTFQRLLEQVVTIADQLTLVRGFADSDIQADFDALIAGQGQTLKDLTANLAGSIRELRAGFTGSAEDLTRLSSLVSQRYDSEIAYLLQIDQVIAGITSGFQGLKEQINRDLFGDEAFYDQITGQAEQLAADLKTMTDPAKIAATVAEIQRLTGVAYSLLDEPGKAANGQGFLDFISGVESDAGAALELARDLFIEESAVLRELVTEMADQFADPLAIAATAHEDAAAALLQAGITMRSAAADMGSVAGQLIGAVREGLGNIREELALPVGGAAINTPNSAGAGAGTTQQSTTQQVVNTIASRLERLESAILSAGSATVGAIHQNGTPTVIVQQAGPGMTLR